jgi:hypothetical protein
LKRRHGMRSSFDANDLKEIARIVRNITLRVEFAD